MTGQKYASFGSGPCPSQPRTLAKLYTTMKMIKKMAFSCSFDNKPHFKFIENDVFVLEYLSKGIKILGR